MPPVPGGWSGAAPGLGSRERRGGVWRGSSVRSSHGFALLYIYFTCSSVCSVSQQSVGACSCLHWRGSAMDPRRGWGSTRTRQPGLSVPSPLSREEAKCPEALATGRLSFYRPCQLLLPAGRGWGVGAAPRGIPGRWEPRAGRAMGTGRRRATGSRCPNPGGMMALRRSRRDNPARHAHFLPGETELPCSCTPGRFAGGCVLTPKARHSKALCLEFLPYSVPLQILGSVTAKVTLRPDCILPAIAS